MTTHPSADPRSNPQVPLPSESPNREASGIAKPSARPAPADSVMPPGLSPTAQRVPGVGPPPPTPATGTDLTADRLRTDLFTNLALKQGKDEQFATLHDYYMALAYSVRDQLLRKRIKTAKTYAQHRAKVVYYLSAEFLMGRQLGNGLINLGLYDTMRDALAECGLDLENLLEGEAEPGLGNGGLGRLAACFMDSLTTLSLPAVGYGIRYEFGIFTQAIRQGHQVEVPDKWLSFGNPWEVARPDYRVEVAMGGYTETYTDGQGYSRVRWVPGQRVTGIPYDVPVPGYGTDNVNLLRLWKAEASDDFDLTAFNAGDYAGAVANKMMSENISKVLYPNDDTPQGKELRLQQQYFFVACSLRDIIRLHLRTYPTLDNLPVSASVQLNDTHPAIGVAELMRLLVDDYQFPWERAWDITQRVFSYTNHTLLPEALERWSVDLFATLLPRHLEIIYEINHRFLQQVEQRYPQQPEKLARLSLIEESPQKQVRMAHLACVGSHGINGVAALHTELLKQDVLHDFYNLYPERFSNKTNGITPRRWLLLCNPRLSQLISETIGESWITHLDDLRQLEAHVGDPEFRQRWLAVKQANKADLARHIGHTTGVAVNPESLFDVQIKRIHEYKRQLLNVLHVITLYNRILRHPDDAMVPRTVIFGGKAAPGYAMAKLIIRLVTAVAAVVNTDPVVAGRLRVLFLPNYNVSYAQRLFPAADLSEQISTAGKEASGTGNMKFALNGALTIGTLDGANVEIREAVGADNFFLFGMTVDQVHACKSVGYNPWFYYDTNPELKRALDLIASGLFAPGEPNLFMPLLDSLLVEDPFMVLADYAAYIQCQEQVGRTYMDLDRWTTMAILNTARVGQFSSDRTIQQYADEIWRVQPVPVSKG